MDLMLATFCKALDIRTFAIFRSPRKRGFNPAAFVLLAGMASGLGGCAGMQAPGPQMAEAAPEVALPQAMRMAEAVRASGDITAAAVFYRRAHALAPQNPEPLIGLADAASANRSYESAVDLYRKALALAPGDAGARLGYGRALLALGRVDLARVELESAIERDPYNYRAYLTLGVALDLAGESLEAQRVYQAGLRHSPENLSLRNNLALSLALSGRTSEAIDMLRAMAYQPAGSSRIRQNLALTHAVAGDLEQAEQIAAHDLKGTALLRQLAFLRSLGGLSGPELASAMMCACAPGRPAGQEPGAQASPAEFSLAPVAEQVAAASPRRSPSAASSKRRSRMVARGKMGGSGSRRIAALTRPHVAEVLNGSKTLVVVRDQDQAVSPEPAGEPHASAQQGPGPTTVQRLADMQASLADRDGTRPQAGPAADPDGS
jgi:Flp pilus assembly protein TadD